MKKILIVIAGIFILNACASTAEIQDKKITLEEKVEIFNQKLREGEIFPVVPYRSKIDSFSVTEENLNLYFNKNFSYLPFREENVAELYDSVKKMLLTEKDNQQARIFVENHPIEELIPNLFRKNKSEYDVSRLAKQGERGEPVIRKLGQTSYESGLSGKNVVLWHSHGWYYSRHSQRWEWQRPRLFQTVEDLVPMSFTIPFIIPMLENAGANVFVPRERDIQTHEVVIDNDTKDNINYKNYQEFDELDGHLWQTDSTGFAYGEPPYGIGVNPFTSGTSRYIKSSEKRDAHVMWIPDIPETGEYAVYVSWQMSDSNVTDAHYTVFHEGGKTEFLVNQQKGGGTWMYLGTFKFRFGNNDDNGVILTNESSQPGKIVSADAVRFGGGMGLVERGGSVSGRPKFIEGARYWLQYAGMPDTLVYSFQDNSNDYNDDYKSRGEYANFLMGAPFGPNRNRDVEGLHIPVDASIAFHTDAGITTNDTTVGTLLIYSSTDLDSVETFPDGVSRMANRDFGDIMQSQIVNDIRANHDPSWSRRQLKDDLYSESFRPNTPAVLLELLSHQNFLDMQFMLDPRFKFDVSRAMYKAVVKFLAVQNGHDFIIQPLPVNNFAGEFVDSTSIKLTWKPVSDPLEPTASATRYKVYRRFNDKDFDSGVITTQPNFIALDLKPGNIYSFKVTAENDGGESFPSEILSFGIAKNSNGTALIVNGFDRVSAPESFQDSNYAGFNGFLDNGVAYKYDVGFTGYQYDFAKKSEFITNDAPGHGASFADHETEVIAGNTFDYTYIHGSAMMANNFSFVSCSDESVENGDISLNKYPFVDMLYGEEKSSPRVREKELSANTEFKIYTPAMVARMKEYLDTGGKMLVSGAYVSSEIFEIPVVDTTLLGFAKNYLHISHGTDHASRKGIVISKIAQGENEFKFEFNTSLNKYFYAVESPDEVMPNKLGFTLFRYAENNFSAAVGFRENFGVITMGFPFEAVKKSEVRNMLMKQILDYLK